MKILKLVINNILYRPLPSFLSILAVAVGTVMILSVIILYNGFNESFEAESSRAELIVGADGGSVELMMSTLFHYEDPIGNIPYEVFEELEDDDRVSRAVPFALGDSYKGFRIGGISEEYISDLNFTDKKDNFIWDSGEAVIGKQAAKETDLSIGDTFRGVHGILCSHDYHGEDADGDGEHEHGFTYRVVGLLDEKGTGDDLMIYTPVKSVWEAHTDEEGDLPKEITAIFLHGKGMVELNEIHRELDEMSGIQTVFVPDMLRQIVNVLGDGSSILKIMAYTTLVLAVLTIMAVLSSTMAERKREGALLRAIGANRRFVFSSIFLETFVITLIGVIIGGALSHLGVMALSGWVTHQTGILIDPFKIVSGEVTAIVAVLAVGAFVGLVFGFVVYKVDPTKN